MALAIFDLDNTLIGGDSDHAWGEFVSEQGYVDGKEFQAQNDRFYQQYLQGQLDIDAYLRFALAPLKDQQPETLQQWHSEFMASKIKPMWLPKAEDLLQQHRDQGDYLLIITATNLFVTEPIAQQLTVDDIIASEGETLEGRYTGEPKGIPCFQEGKVQRLQQWLKSHSEHQLEGSYFYSDSHNDIALMSVVDNAIAVDPDEKLARHAELQGWPVISLR